MEVILHRLELDIYLLLGKVRSRIAGRMIVLDTRIEKAGTIYQHLYHFDTYCSD